MLPYHRYSTEQVSHNSSLKWVVSLKYRPGISAVDGFFSFNRASSSPWAFSF